MIKKYAMVNAENEFVKCVFVDENEIDNFIQDYLNHTYFDASNLYFEDIIQIIQESNADRL